MLQPVFLMTLFAVIGLFLGILRFQFIVYKNVLLKLKYEYHLLEKKWQDDAIESQLRQDHREEREDLKRVEEILHDREARLQAIFSNAAVGIVTLNPQGRLLRANKKFLSMLGYSVEDLSTLDYLEITYPEDRPLSTQYFNQLVSGQINTYHLEKRYLRKEGSFLGECFYHIGP